MEAFHDVNDITQPIDLEKIERAQTEPALPRTVTRRRKSSYIGLVPMQDVRCLAVGTALYGPNGEQGYLAGIRGELVELALIEWNGQVRNETILGMRPEAFSGWTSSGGIKL